LNLIKGALWAKDNFVSGSEPTSKKLYKWVSEGALNGCIIGTDIFIEVDALSHHPKNKENINKDVDIHIKATLAAKNLL
jgi:hypothetical protein